MQWQCSDLGLAAFFPSLELECGTGVRRESGSPVLAKGCVISAMASEPNKYSGELKHDFSPSWFFHDAIIWWHVRSVARAFNFLSQQWVSVNGVYLLASQLRACS